MTGRKKRWDSDVVSMDVSSLSDYIMSYCVLILVYWMSLVYISQYMLKISQGDSLFSITSDNPEMGEQAFLFWALRGFY